MSLRDTAGPLPDDLLGPLSLAAGRLGPFGREIRWHRDTSSTNDLAGSLADAGAAEGVVVVAEAQSAGRGRHGRRWASPAGAGLYFSTVLRPPPRAVPLLTIAAGLAVAEGIEAATGLVADLKWPNDVHVHGRKVAGVLAEAKSGAGAGAHSQPRTAALQHVVVGIGINVMAAAYPPEIAPRATSLEAELGRGVERGLLLAECLAALATRYGDLHAGRRANVVSAWRMRAAATFGRAVEWDGPRGVVHGSAEDIDDSGALIVRTYSGLHCVSAGQVRWV